MPAVYLISTSIRTATACSHYPSGDYVLENVYFTNDVLTATAIGDGLMIGSLTCDLNQAWEFDTQGP
jgi:hypothetical protein